MADRGLITAHRRGYQPGDLDGAWLVLACTDRPEVNEAVAADAERQRLWCARADDAAASAAWVPAVGRAGAVTVAVNAGRDPRRAAELRDHFVDTAGTVDRLAAKEAAGGSGGQPAAGRVSIVGGGPGDPGLITVAGLHRLREADVVVTDRLAPLALLEQLAPGVQVVDAAKVPGGPAMRQDHINHALVEHARAGRAVVRLKGGDPFVFGRGREEVEACLTAGVPVEVVPGVTSAISVPAAAGIPVTHRGVSQGFCVLAGHVRPGDSRSSVDWAALARSGHDPGAADVDRPPGRDRGDADLRRAGRRDPGRGGVRRLEPAAAGGDGAAPGPGRCGAGGWRHEPGGRGGRRRRRPGRHRPGDARRSPVPPRPVLPRWPVVPRRPAAPGRAADAGDSALPGTTADGRDAAVRRRDRRRAAARRPGPGPGAASSAASGAAGPGRRVLVLGGARSGKSAAAEGMLAGDGPVDYVATGTPPGSGDTEWDARVAEHRRRRPAHWRTVETLALAEVLAAPGPAPVLVDCLTTWLARVMDDCGAWDGTTGAAGALAARTDQVLAAWRDTGRQVIAVSNEIGSGVVPGTASGRRFRDETGATERAHRRGQRRGLAVHGGDRPAAAMTQAPQTGPARPGTPGTPGRAGLARCEPRLACSRSSRSRRHRRSAGMTRPGPCSGCP